MRRIFFPSFHFLAQNLLYLKILLTCASCHGVQLYVILFIGSLQFLFGSAHVMKLPLFRQACELAFAECKSGGNDYILEHEVYFSFPPFAFSFSPLYICLVVF